MFLLKPPTVRPLEVFTSMPDHFRRTLEKTMKTKLLAAGLATIAIPALADTPVLTVLTYDSFTAEWGPGPLIEKGFEETCGCDVKFVTAGDGAAVLARLKLEGTTTDADVVVGLDTNLTADAAPLTQFIASYSSPEGLFWAKLSAASTMAIAPILVLGWFAQKQLVRGLTFGAVK